MNERDNYLLVCERCTKPTHHTFAGQQKINRPGAWALYVQMYRCDECQTPRQFGAHDFRGVGREFVQ